MSSVWEQRLDGLIRAQAGALSLLQTEVLAARRNLSSAQDALDRLETRVQTLTAKFDADAAKVMSRKHDPEVVIRNYNETSIYTYHADTRCGWVRNPKWTKKILLSEAQERGYYPCKSCGRRVPKPGPESAAA